MTSSLYQTYTPLISIFDSKIGKLPDNHADIVLSEIVLSPESSGVPVIRNW